MNPIIVMIVFMLNGHAVGAKLAGSTDTVSSCQTGAAKIIADMAGQEPAIDGKRATAFPVCIDTKPMVATLADSPRVGT